MSVPGTLQETPSQETSLPFHAGYPGGADFYGVTRKFTLLVSVRWGVITFTLPVVAPVGTVVVISELETT